MHSLAWLLLAACSNAGLTPVPKDPSPADDPDATDDTPPAGDSAPPDDTAPPAEDTAPPEDTGATSPVVTRFVALGDAGTGDDKQRRVAGALAQVCAARGCDFAVYLGDNFYNDGVTSADDRKFQDAFETPYAALDFPFWAVLGNHDYGGGGGGWEPYRTDAQVAYTERSAKWRMPDQFWREELGEVTLFGLDTTALAWERAEDLEAWFPGARDGAQGRWRIALGHHTFLSNGPHGNAGAWDGGNGGRRFRDFFEREVCGKVDLYLGGHDHSLQWPVSTCPGTEFVVTGAGGKTSRVGEGNVESWFEASTLGFLHVEIAGDTLQGTFYDADGAARYTRTVTRTRGG
jgi:tartrate-resistant acid phosphatase type 5